MSAEDSIDSETRLLAAMAYGESSSHDVTEEISALASVLVRQRDARKYSSIHTFASSDRTFSFVVKDGNRRFQKLMNATVQQLNNDHGMNAAVKAAKNALAGGVDLSNGAYFWDGADIKSNYNNHFKVRQGIRFVDQKHNIYNISESTKLVVLTKTVVKKSKGKIVDTVVSEMGRYDHIYVSTAAYGGTIFWRHNPDYMSVTGAKAYK